MMDTLPSEPHEAGAALRSSLARLEQLDAPRAGEPTRRRTGLIVAGAVLLVALASGAFWAGRATAPDISESIPGISDAGALLQDALALHIDGDTDAARLLYLEVLVLEPDNVYAHYNLGVIEQSEGRLPRAIEQYEAALRTDPAYGPALYNAGLAYASAGDPQTAIERLRAAAVVTPDSAPVMFNLGQLLVESGEEEEGNALLQAAFDIDPSLELEP
jgi:tetratricopeptide (TPR) repeat protein